MDSKMKMLEVEYIDKRPLSAADVPSVLEAAGIKTVTLDYVNWSNFYPYKPCVCFQIAHTGDAILISWNVEEEVIRGKACDNGDVWKDSCVEFFVSFDGGITYYNIECNCRGGKLCGYGKNRDNRFHATEESLKSIDVAVSVGDKPFDTRKADGPWQVSMIIPLSLFTHESLINLRDITADANFYKCGDDLPRPHYLSWLPVQTPLPNFHSPEFFGRLHFK